MVMIAPIEERNPCPEDTLPKIRLALSYWQTWEAEYEAFKEAVEETSNDSDSTDLCHVMKSFEGDLLQPKECDELLGLNKSNGRTPMQVIGMVNRRIDYVKQNVQSLRKQLDTTESVTLAKDDDHNVDAFREPLPEAEIIEQLDDNDVPLSGRVVRPLDLASQAHEYGNIENAARSKTKSVSFAENDDAAINRPGDSRCQHFNAQDKESPASTIDESAEDAALRRDMMHYRLSEMGSVVAELNLDQVDSDESDFEGLSDSEISAFETDEEEDHGVSLSSGISDKYRAEMLALEKKLNAQMIQNIGPGSFKELSTAKVVLQHEDELKSAALDTAPGKKNVRFANDLELGPAAPKHEASTIYTAGPTNPEPVTQDTIVERLPEVLASSTPAAPRKKSLFKTKCATTVQNTAISDEEPDATRFELRRPVSASVHERPQHQERLDRRSAKLQQELAAEYYRQRNRLIQKEGGFTAQADDDDEIFQGQDGFKKQSLFKAARVGARRN